MSFLNTLAVTAGVSMIFFSYTFYLVLEIDFSILKKVPLRLVMLKIVLFCWSFLYQIPAMCINSNDRALAFEIVIYVFPDI